DREYQVPTAGTKLAFLIEKNMPADKLLTILEAAKEERASGKQVNIVMMKKNKKFQKEQMKAEGYEEFREFFVDRM
ncbi:MAG: histidine--tRNA ligase, partial [Lachnospiraceae bacterium]|nr:histidine--tRNA ligase [Lachnospiraceae bacterium]